MKVFKLPIVNYFSKARSAVVQWLKGDIFQPDSYKESMKSVDAVVSCVGAFGSNEVSNWLKNDHSLLTHLFECRSLWKR